jgi:hypothetical protein
MPIELGDLVRDRITGFKGIATGHTKWLNKCERFGVQGQKLEAGKVQDAQWFDAEQLEVVKKAAFVVKKDKTGGPRDYETVRRADATR